MDTGRGGRLQRKAISRRFFRRRILRRGCYRVTNTDFEHRGTYDKFALYAHLSHDGDYSQAAKALASQGYGERWSTRKNRKPVPTEPTDPANQILEMELQLAEAETDPPDEQPEQKVTFDALRADIKAAAFLYDDPLAQAEAITKICQSAVTLPEAMQDIVRQSLLDAKLFTSKTDANRAFRFVRDKLLSSTSSCPVIFDEYKPSDMLKTVLDDLHHTLREAYDGQKAFRGTRTQQLIEYPYTAPVVISGKVALTEGALLERILLIEMNPNDLTDVARTAHLNLRRLPLQAFMSRYIPFCLNTDFDSELQTAEAQLEATIEPRALPDRVRKNLTVMIFGFNQFIRFCKEFGSEQIVRKVSFFRGALTGVKVL